MVERVAAVVGGGIGGLAAALALHRSGWEVVVLERAGEFTEVGAGLSLWPNAMRALEALGLADRVRAIGAVETAGGVRDRSGRWLSRVDNGEIAERHGWPLVVVHRAELVRVLVEALPPTVLRPGIEVRAVRPDGEGVVVEYRRGGGVRSGGGTRVVGPEGRDVVVGDRGDEVRVVRSDGGDVVVEHEDGGVRSGAEVRAPRPDGEARGAPPPGEGVEVEHRDGSVRADLVVGADGLRSVVREQWWPDAAEPVYSGCVAWRMITEPLPGLRPEGAVLWGRGERFGFTALPGGRFYCFAAAAVPADSGGGHAEVLRRFGDWPDPIPALLAAVPEDRVLRHDVHALPPLPTYVRGRAVLLGDAAHAMDPMLGQGACQALEDAVTLADCLAKTPDVDVALARYDEVRRPRTRAIVRRSARLGSVALWSWPPAVAVRDLAARAIPAAATLRSMAPVLGWTPPGAL